MTEPAPTATIAPPPSAPPPHPAEQRAPIAFAGFVALVAALMALGALGVDMMLPALPIIGRDLGAGGVNAQQYVISVYLAGLGVGQLLHGPLSDRYGRRPVMLGALAVYALANIVAAATTSLAVMLAVRFVAASAVAATRVVTIAIVRDCYSGRPMARTMSLAAMVFMIAPVLAPTLGQGVLLIGDWRLIFWTIAALTAIVATAFAIAMPETLDPAARRPFSPRQTLAGFRATLADRLSAGYTLAQTAMQGALFGYITSVQQIVSQGFGQTARLNIVFALTAGAMAAISLLNARLVMRLGSRVLSQVALVALIAAAALALALARSGAETLIAFVVLQSVMMGCFSLANSNFSALAMTNMGAIAGTASSIQGFCGLTLGAIIGGMIGQAYAGTTVPLHLGFLLAGAASLGIVAAVERGRLFRPG